MVEEILLQHKSFFGIAGVVENMIRWILWKIISFLTYLADSLEGIMDKIYTLNDFFRNPQVEALLNTFKPIFWSLLTVSILYIGYKIVVDREFKGERIFQNFIISSMVIFCLPTLMVNLEQITTRAVNIVKIEEQATTTARNIIKDNLYDLEYLEKNNFNLGDYENDSRIATNSLNPKNLLNLNINEVMDKGGFLNPKNEVYSKKIELDINGEPKVVNLSKAFFNLIQEEYYRFNFDFFNIIVSLLCLILTFILTSIKIARIIVELAFKKIFAIFLAFSDIETGQRLKTVLKDILSSFAIIFVTAILLKLYTIGITWVGTLNATWLVKLVFTIVLSLMVIDAPNIVERVFGIDAGIKSGWGLIAGAYTGFKTIGEMGKMANEAIGTARNTVGNVGAGISGIAGVYDGFKDKTFEDERNKNNNSLNNTNSNNRRESNSNISDVNLGSNSRNTGLYDNENNLDNRPNQSINKNLDKYNGISQNDNISNGYGSYNSLSDEVNSNKDINSQTDISEDNKISSSINNKDNVNDISTNTLENDRNLNNQDIYNDANKGIGTLENDRNSKLEEINNSNNKGSINEIPNNEIPSKSNKIENRTIGQYAKDKFVSSKPIEKSKKYYQLGVNTGEKLSKMAQNNKKIKKGGK